MLTFERADLADMCAASANFLMNRIAVRGSLKPDFIDAEVSARLFIFMESEPSANADVLYGVARRSGYSRHVAIFEDELLQVRMAFEAYVQTYRSMRPVLDQYQAHRQSAAAALAQAAVKPLPVYRGVLDRGPRMGAVRLGMKRLGKHTRVIVRRVKAIAPTKPRTPRGPGGKFVKRK